MDGGGPAAAGGFDGTVGRSAIPRSDEADGLLPAGGTAAAAAGDSAAVGAWAQQQHLPAPPAHRGRRRTQQLALGAAALSLVVSFAALFLAAAGPRGSPAMTSRRAAGADALPPTPPAPYTVFALDRQKTTKRTRLALGSCTSYDLRSQPVWTRGVIPFDPDAWVWLGDMSYLDDAPIDCGAAIAAGADDAARAAGCVCPADWLRRPGGCFAADPAHAARRVAHQLAVSEYQAFVAHMCPAPSGASPSPSPPPPHFPPPPSACARPILGTWDDHDYGANNGDARNPAKAQIKELYLDMIGEPRGSARRGGADGLQAEYRFNFLGERERGGGGEGEEAIQLLLTDGRWYREPMPCSRRERWCRAVLSDFEERRRKGGGAGESGGGGGSKSSSNDDVSTSLSSDADAAWCDDFLRTGDPSGAVGGGGGAGGGGGGSCCRKDDEWAAWCAHSGEEEEEEQQEEQARRQRSVCDPLDAGFAMTEAVLLPAAYAAPSSGVGGGRDGEEEEGETAVFDLSAAWAAKQRGSSSSSNSGSNSSSSNSSTSSAEVRALYYRRLVEGADSPMCEVLGQRQRRWLRSALARSRAPLRVVASGSVLLGSLLYGQEEGAGEKAAATAEEERARPQVCSGDDWACWSRAQLNFLHTLANASAGGVGEGGGGVGGGGGCVVVIAGDYHYSDIKVARPSPSSSSSGASASPSSSSSSPAAVEQLLRLDRLARPVYQLMSSGLTGSTASQHAGAPCEGTYREDLAGLRPLGRCSYVARPAFGAIEVDWRARWFELSVRDAEGGGVARGEDGALQRVRVSLYTCEVIEMG